MSRNKIKYLIWMCVFLVGLWLAACKSTPGTSTPLPPQPQAGETKDTPQSASSPPEGSAQPEARQNSKTGPPPSPEASAAHQPESKEKSSDRQTAPAGEAGAPPQETDQGMPQNRRTAPQTADERLAKARDDLRVSQATEKRIASELEQLKNSGSASDVEIRNYETYLDRVQAMVAENRKMVEKMERAYAEHQPDQKTSGTSSKLSDQQIPEEQDQDPVTVLDRQLSASLSEFDAKLSREMESIETASTAKMRKLAREAAEAARRSKEKGGESESSAEAAENGKEVEKEEDKGKENRSDKSDKTADQTEAKDIEAPDEKENGSKKDNKTVEDDAALAQKSETIGGEGKGRYGKEQDDDIVARQLREAAENETDPEIKEKLWKEYEEYKKSTE